MVDLKTATLKLEMSFQKHPDEEFKQLVGRCNITLWDYDKESYEDIEETVGEIEFSFHHLSMYDEDLQDLYFEIDAESADKDKLVKDFLHFLYETESFDLYSFITIDKMRIQKEYRGSGLGEKALRELLDLVSYMNVDYIILQPAPIDTLEEDEKRIEKIKQIASFYEKVGFRCYQTKDNEAIMIYREWVFDEPVDTFIKSEDIEGTGEIKKSYLRGFDLTKVEISPSLEHYFRQNNSKIIRLQVPIKEVKEYIPPSDYASFPEEQEVIATLNFERGTLEIEFPKLD